MLKEVLTALDYSTWAEVSLFIFVGVFFAVSIRTLLSTRRTNDARAQLVFDLEAKGHDDV